jgi:hypothetical protein
MRFQGLFIAQLRIPTTQHASPWPEEPFVSITKEAHRSSLSLLLTILVTNRAYLVKAIGLSALRIW